MGFFQLFHKNKKVLLRCASCYAELELDIKQVRLIEKERTHDSICPVKQPCLNCLKGFLIPVNYTDENGKSYFFHNLKSKAGLMSEKYIYDLCFLDDADPPPPF